MSESRIKFDLNNLDDCIFLFGEKHGPEVHNLPPVKPVEAVITCVDDKTLTFTTPPPQIRKARA